MSITPLYYSIPKTLEREKSLVIAKCNILIEAFNELAKEEENRLKEEEKKLYLRLVALIMLLMHYLRMVLLFLLISYLLL